MKIGSNDEGNQNTYLTNAYSKLNVNLWLKYRIIKQVMTIIHATHNVSLSLQYTSIPLPINFYDT